MRPDDADLGYLWDMRKYAREVQELVEGVEFDEFVADWRLRRAVERCIEVVGEAAGRVSAEFRANHPEIAWRPITAQRHVPAHEYGEIRDDAIWRVATLRIPELLALLAGLLPDEAQHPTTDDPRPTTTD